ncbi:MAG TPA: hypothetical protein VF142_10465 [Longimicrobium sp.]
MWIRTPFPACLLAPLLAACGDPPPLVLVHATDPHLLEGKNPHEQATNLLAFSEMMDWVSEGKAGDPTPPYLVVTGDFGIEWADPLRSPGPGPLPGGPTLAGLRREELANTVAQEIRGSTFRRVYFVPGNNDVLLEEADPRTWSGIDAFVRAVQSRLVDQEFIDLTACYRNATFRASDCYARLEGGYVLVGFPTISFKNELDPAEYDQFVRGRRVDSTLTTEEGLKQWADRQDPVHQELLGRLGHVLSEATAGGWRAVIVTHIPGLEDPYHRDNPQARAAVHLGLRRVQPPRPDAWNVSKATFDQWLDVVRSPRVAAVLAGHFHASDRSKYEQPYTWSLGTDRVSASKTFVVPPLAIKKQDRARPRARGFAVLTLTAQAVRRQLYWYNDENRSSDNAFQRDDGTPPGQGPSAPAAALGEGAAARTDAETGRRLAYSLSFVLALLTAYAAFVGWRTDAGANRWNPAPTWALIQRMAKWWNAREEHTRTRILNSVRTALPASFWGTSLVALETIWDLGRTFWFYTVLWFAIAMGVAYLLRFVVIPRLQQGHPAPAPGVIPAERRVLVSASSEGSLQPPDIRLQGPHDVPAAGDERDRERGVVQRFGPGG